MKQVIEDMKNGKVRIVDLPVPQCGSNELLIQNRTSLISPGTEKLLIEMGKKSIAGKAMARPDLVRLAYQKAKREGFISVFREALARLDEPMPLGYSAAGVVIEAGRNVTGFAKGDYVAYAGSAIANHAEYNIVPPDLCIKIPLRDNNPISFDEASFIMLGGIALQGFREAQLSFGENVTVIGLGLIGLLTVQIAKAYGCKVFGIDVSKQKIEKAKQLGCDYTFIVGKDEIESSIQNLTNGFGTDAVIITAASSDNKPIVLAETIARQRGRIVLVGMCEIKLTRKAFWDKELSFTVSKANGPGLGVKINPTPLTPDLYRWTEKRNLEEFLRLISSGAINTKTLITHRYSIDNAVKAYEMILKGKESYIGVILEYKEDKGVHEPALISKKLPAAVKTGDRKNLGLIGAGMFAKNIILPQFKKSKKFNFIGVADKIGLNAQHIAERYGFSYTTADYSKILADSTIGSVAITTRHDIHSTLVCEALQAGKAVYVEKPLCISQKQLEGLASAINTLSKKPILLVGFNRRYSPLSDILKNHLIKRTTPLQINFRINAGFIPVDHWVHDPLIGGGRIIGEGCHFIDYMQYLTNASPIEVYAQSIGPNTGRYLRSDNINIAVRFSDGSLGTIQYTALGSKAFSRERVEVFGDESVAVLDDFRTLEIVKGAKKIRHKLSNQDMGYRNEILAFLELNDTNSMSLIRQAFLTSLATFVAEESLRTGKPVEVSLAGFSV